MNRPFKSVLALAAGLALMGVDQCPVEPDPVTCEAIDGETLTACFNMQADEIRLHPGTFEGCWELPAGYGPDISAIEGPGTSLLTGGCSVPILSVTGVEEMYVNSLTFTGGGEYGRSIGGAISATDSNVDILNTRFDNNRAWKGGGISAVNSELYIIDSSFESNWVESAGGAISASAGSLYILRTPFTYNGVDDGNGGAISVTNGTVVHVLDSRFRENRSTDGGAGAIFADDASVWVGEGSSFYDSQATSLGGAIKANGFSYVMTQDVRFDYSVSLENSGGAVSVTEDAVYTAYRTVFANSRSCSGGGAIYADMRANVYLTNSLLVDSVADGEWCFTGNGGAVALLGNAQSYVVNSTFVGNNAYDNGGAIWVDSGAVLQLESSILAQNTAEAEGASVYVATGASTRLEWSNFYAPLNGVAYTGVYGATPDGTNISANPLFVQDYGFEVENYFLQAGSPSIDAGSPDEAKNDPDGTRNDQGFTGGPDSVPAE